MKVTYTADGAEPQVWDFEPDEVPQSQAEMIEKRYGRGPGQWEEWSEDVRRGGARARRILLWHLLRQVHHTLRFEDTPDFKMGQVKVEHSVSELQRIRDRVVKSNLPDEEKDEALTLLDIEITEQMGDALDGAPDEADEPAEARPGKASRRSA